MACLSRAGFLSTSRSIWSRRKVFIPAALRCTPATGIPIVRRTLASSSLPPSPSFQLSPWRRFLQTLGRVTLVTILTSGGVFLYITHKDRTPGPQEPFDPSKKTIVILGSGWGATSLLKSLDNEDYNVVVISPRNYFLFTPLLPSVAIGTLDPRSIIQSTRYITRHKKRIVHVYEAEATEVDPVSKTVTYQDTSPVKGQQDSGTIKYDYLVYAVGAETQTFNIPGVKEHSCFMKELKDAEKMRTMVMDCIESAAVEAGNPDSQDDINRLLHMVVVGGGPTGVELSGELHDFIVEDLKQWYPELADRVRVTLIEALPNVLPMFSKQLIQYTESTFKENKIDVLTRTMVKEINEKSVIVQNDKGELVEIPFGVLVWAAGNVGRALTRDLMAKIGATQSNKRGLEVDDFLRIKGAEDIFAIGDCTATSYAPTAQVATQQGVWLARHLGQITKKERLEARLRELRSSPGSTPEAIETTVKHINKQSKFRPFHYSHQGSLAYIGSDKAIADLPFLNGNLASGGVATFLFWRSAYVSNLFSLRNRVLVINDWLKVKLFGRDVSRD
ncbi:putative NADH dehydrogenase [Cantharellus anzutake]|uniref:putative NADH dehydrogenase n=1 Tax=Cantharellus anzutake TaxID=1750568 RepID=UPI001907A82F|nr:putative NADH dehydrogenase [Cantharellus anzutake]KAF8342834.1 putative NADH dehydrogenase [Cantharellus anzutake]